MAALGKRCGVQEGGSGARAGSPAWADDSWGRPRAPRWSDLVGPPRRGCAWASRLGLGELHCETAAPSASPAPRRPAPRGRRCFRAVADSPSTAAVWQPLSRLFILERWVGTGENQGELWGPLCVAWRHLCFPKSLVWRSFGNVSALLPCHSL